MITQSLGRGTGLLLCSRIHTHTIHTYKFVNTHTHHSPGLPLLQSQHVLWLPGHRPSSNSCYLRIAHCLLRDSRSFCCSSLPSTCDTLLNAFKLRSFGSFSFNLQNMQPATPTFAREGRAPHSILPSLSCGLTSSTGYPTVHTSLLSTYMSLSAPDSFAIQIIVKF